MTMTTDEIIKAIEPAWVLFGAMQQRPGARFSVAAEREKLGKAMDALRAMKADALDAERWRETLMHVGAVEQMGGQAFTLATIKPADRINLMRGSAAQHFTKAIDASIAAKDAGGPAA